MAAPPPCQNSMTKVNDSPMEIQTALSMAASLKVTTWAERWTRSRSATSSTLMNAISAAHAQTAHGS